MDLRCVLGLHAYRESHAPRGGGTAADYGHIEVECIRCGRLKLVLIDLSGRDRSMQVEREQARDRLHGGPP